MEVAKCRAVELQIQPLAKVSRLMARLRVRAERAAQQGCADADEEFKLVGARSILDRRRPWQVKPHWAISTNAAK